MKSTLNMTIAIYMKESLIFKIGHFLFLAIFSHFFSFRDGRGHHSSLDSCYQQHRHYHIRVL